MNPLALIIEDNHTLSEVFSISLEAAGYKTECILDGQAAMDAIDVAQPQLILLDLHLPKVSGATILEKIRASYDSSADVKVIVVSADGRLTISDEVRDQANIVLQKPVSIKQLTTIATRFLA